MATANPNLAFLKYWGKKDVENNIPSNSSLSINLDNLKTITNIQRHTEDKLILDNKEQAIPAKMMKLLDLFRKLSGSTDKIKITSENNFPSACGMASSASGYAALVLSLNDYFKTNLSKSDLSEYARMGSGSASRSIFDGIVLMEEGISRKLCDWPDIKVISIQLNSKAKKVSSTEGMLRSASTSYFYKKRLEHVSCRLEEMISAISNKNFGALAELIMKDSNELHSICMDSYPPIRYINDEGFKIIEMVHEFNSSVVKCAYSFDAGTNPFIITLKDFLSEVKQYFSNYNIIECN